MKFGKYLEEQAAEHPEWQGKVMDYSALKDILKALHAVAKPAEDGEAFGRPNKPFASLTVPASPEGFGVEPTAYIDGKPVRESDFFKLLDQEVEKMGFYTNEKVKELRAEVEALDEHVTALAQASDSEKAKAKPKLEAEAQALGDAFLSLEKYVNLCYMGFYKILKKHDKMLPATPARQFYMSKLHTQRWIFGDFSDVFVHLSHVYSILRGDVAAKKKGNEQQNFVRSTKKYWVRTEDVTTIKHYILQHLPVDQLNQAELPGDSQLTNSVYLDNASLELYHNRMDKRPGAIAMRIRWYGTGDIKVCFIERKTHRESWKGEVSVKERFTLKEAQVVPFLTSQFTWEDKAAEMKAAGKSEEDVESCRRLFTEMQQQVDSKQLQPCVRTQYMRVPFQIPFNPTVRISLDTNLTMVKENPDDQPPLLLQGRWCRDPSLPVPRTEITHFPHAVLEVKLSLAEGQEQPLWVSDMLDSGMCVHVHKFSKFMHGCAVLLPDRVQAVPYWFDDKSLRDSILDSAPLDGAYNRRDPLPAPTTSEGPDTIRPFPQQFVDESKRAAKEVLKKKDSASTSKEVQYGKTAAKELVHPLLPPQAKMDLMKFDKKQYLQDEEETPGCTAFWNTITGASIPVEEMVKVEPKVFFANERTFLHWLHMATTIGTIAAAILAFSVSRRTGAGIPIMAVLALVLVALSMIFILYACYIFTWRMNKIRMKKDGPYDDRKGPIFLAATMVVALWAIFVISCIKLIEA